MPPIMGSGKKLTEESGAKQIAETSLNGIYRPILRGYFMVYAFYYGIMLGLNALSMEHNLGFVALQSATIVAAVFALFGARSIRKSSERTTTEFLLFVMNLLVVGNVWIALTIDFLPEKLTYFIIMSMLFALASTSFRQSLASIALALIAMSTFLGRLDDATFAAFGFLSFGAALSSLAIAFYLRKAIARIARANNMARDELVRAQVIGAQMREQSLSDSLTGLPNRRAFFAELSLVVAERDQARSEQGQPSGRTWLVLLDLDGFKAVNDVHGHKTGDLLLTAIAERLRDFAKTGANVSRMGGDEFNLIVSWVKSEGELRDRCTKLLRDLAEPYILEGRQVRVSCSAGCVPFDPSEPADGQISNADYALMVAKKQGKNQVVFFDQKHENEARVRLQIETALRLANLKDEISVVFQPQVRLGDNEVVGAEVLARWASPQVGTIPPTHFIKIAEESGLVTDITLVVIEKALHELEGWKRKLPLSMNLSAHDLMSDPAIDQIIALIERYDISPSLIEFEVTETAMMGDLQKATANLTRLSEAGYSIALDDFGTGYSNFSYLRSLPITRLKVDRSFVDDPSDPMAEKVLSSLVGMARVLGVNCLLEGVEDEFSLLMAKRAGAELVQGYLFAEPISALDMRNALAKGLPLIDRRSETMDDEAKESRPAILRREFR